MSQAISETSDAAITASEQYLLVVDPKNNHQALIMRQLTREWRNKDRKVLIWMTPKAEELNLL
jgi:hypothetical protein